MEKLYGIRVVPTGQSKVEKIFEKFIILNERGQGCASRETKRSISCEAAIRGRVGSGSSENSISAPAKRGVGIVTGYEHRPHELPPRVIRLYHHH